MTKMFCDHCKEEISDDPPSVRNNVFRMKWNDQSVLVGTIRVGITKGNGYGDYCEECVAKTIVKALTEKYLL